ncbi:hypothetical protein MTO96_044723 [Rhipicephalus appendiculatus]
MVMSVQLAAYAVSYVASDCGSFMTTRPAAAANSITCAPLSFPAIGPRARCLALKSPVTMTCGNSETTSCTIRSVDSSVYVEERIPIPT